MIAAATATAMYLALKVAFTNSLNPSRTGFCNLSGILTVAFRERPPAQVAGTAAMSTRSASPGPGVGRRLRYHAAMRQPPEFTLEQLTGQARDHIREVPDPRCALHEDVMAPYLAMRAAAAADGLDLVAFSGFRDFNRQLGIWNGKFRGERPLQDRAGRALDALSLPPAERVEAILWWSALPGASRHHWGTDFDVMDAKAMPAGYKLQVIPSEYL